MLDGDWKDRHPAFSIFRSHVATRSLWESTFAFRRPQSTIGNCTAGGIAQLVERQLCKLEVRGSNPLASSSENFRGCRAVALAKADK
jgi:hypothetical protein